MKEMIWINLIEDPAAAILPLVRREPYYVVGRPDPMYYQWAAHTAEDMERALEQLADAGVTAAEAGRTLRLHIIGEEEPIELNY